MLKEQIFNKLGDAPVSHAEQIIIEEICKLSERIRMLETPELNKGWNDFYD